MEIELKDFKKGKLTGANHKLKALILEDLPSDAELVKFQFDELEFKPVFRVTKTREEYLRHLDEFKPDIIISDFNLPQFDGLKALDILRNRFNDDITPFLFVTGTLGEENAVKAIKEGATDFIIKERVGQLPAAILKALREKEERIQRKAANDRERINERRFKKLVQEGSDLIVILDQDWKIQFLSDNYAKILGYPLNDLIKKKPFELVHPEDSGMVKAAFEQVVAKYSIKIEPYRLLDAKKNWRWFQSTVTNMFGDEAVAGIVVNSTEVTDLIEKEQDLKLSNEKYYLASLATQDLIYDWDLKEDSINLDTQALRRLFGHSTLFNQSNAFWNGCIHFEEADIVLNHLRACLQDKDQILYQHHYRFKRKDGSYAFVHDKAYILRDPDGVAIRLIGAIRDISEQKQKEQTRDLILHLSTILSRSDSLVNCTKGVLEVLATHIDVSYGELWMVAHHNNHLNLISYFSEDSSGRTMAEELLRFTKGQGLPGKVFAENKMIFWRGLKNRSNFVRKKSAQEASFESAIGIPITKGDQPIGVFVFFSRDRQYNFKRQLDFLQEVSSWISPELQRKQASEELDRFFTVSADLLCVIGTDGFFKKINPAFTEVLGYSEMEFLRNPLRHFIHPDDHELTRSHLERLQEGKKSTHLENRYFTKDGSIRWFDWSAILQEKEDVIFAVGKEITEKKRLEELVRESQSMAKVGSWEVDLINEKLHWTSQTKEIHEVGQEYQPSLETAINFYDEGESRETIERCVQEGIEEGRSWDVELQIITAKGNKKWIRAIGKAEMSEGKCIRLFGSFQDIDDQKKRQEDLNAMYQRFSLASRAAREAIYEWNCRTNSLTWTDGYSTLFGYEDLQVDFDDWKSKVHALDRERINSSLNELIADPCRQFWKEEYRYMRSDKKVAFVEDRGYLVRDKDGMPLSMIGSVDDLTEKKMFQEQLLENTIQSQENERNRIAQELHDGIVQEMVVCSMRSDLLHKYTNENPELDEKIDEVTDYIKQITNATRDISHNLLSANVAEMNFTELLDRLELNLRIMSKIQFNIEHFLGADFQFDETIKINLFRVIQELANNIIKHSEANKALILVEKIGQTISVRVADNGKGIRGKPTSGGIGLSNVSNRINMIGGKIDFRDGEKGGLEVFVTVPIA